MKNTKYIFILSLCLTLFACGNSKKTNNATVATKKALLVDGGDTYKDNATTTINSATIDQNNLTLEVSYSGGCEEHEFSLMGSKMIQKSLPPKRGIFLYHQNNGDSCRELKEETLVFDISEFAYESGEIILILDGYKEELSYSSK